MSMIKKIGGALCALLCLALHAEHKKISWEPWGATDYSQFAQPQYDASSAFFNAHLRTNIYRVVLDLGCNAGQVTRALAQEYPHTHFFGIDPEHEAIAYACKHTTQHNISFICDTAQEFALPDGIKADLIGYHHAHHWIAKEDNQKTFDNIAAHLVDGGILDMNVLCTHQDEVNRLTKAMLATILHTKWFWDALPLAQAIRSYQNEINSLTCEQVRNFALNAGLTIEICEEIDFVAQFETKEAFAQWVDLILRLYNFKKVLNDETKANEYAADVVDTYCAQFNPADKGIKYSTKMVHLIARKSA